MRLSTARDRDDVRAIAVIHAALDAGATLLDTADSYCHDDSETGHNERLIARALRQWHGDRPGIEVATKGGLRRPKGAWVNDGRGKYLREACEASRSALGVEVLDLYQLHAVDPRTSLETSVRALASLQSDGIIRRIGLCNVTVSQIESARSIADIVSVQVSLSVLDSENMHNGVAEYCREHGIRLIAYRPLGGERRKKLARDPVLSAIAVELAVTPENVALAWVMSFGGNVVPIPGATREETARSISRSLALTLSDVQRNRLDERFSRRLLRVPRASRRPSDDAGGEVVLVMGMPGAGKSSITREFVSAGYARLNRDERGGALSDLLPELDAGLRAGTNRWVLDNTYPTRASRNAVIECAWSHRVPVRCVHLTTTLADAQINAIRRLIEVHGKLPMPEELRERGKDDPRYFGPDAQFRFERTVELPVAGEGYTVVEAREFLRLRAPGSGAKAILLDYDDLLMRSDDGSVALKAEDVRLANGRRAVLARLYEDGWLMFAHAWRPPGARRAAAGADAAGDELEGCLARTRELLGFDVTFGCCVHDAGPPVCWCRKPLPGLMIEFAMRKGVSLESSLVVGTSAADRTLATKVGAQFQEAQSFFGEKRAI